MAGFPTRANRAAFGPTLQDYKPVTDPTREIGAATLNLSHWQLAGLGRVAARAVLRCTVSGGVVTTAEQLLAWDANGSISPIVWTYLGVGFYRFAFATSYHDELGNDVNLILTTPLASQIPAKATNRTGSHDGAKNQPQIDDSTKSWVVNSLVGLMVMNITDGSRGIITANTAVQCTVGGGMTGGVDNDFDTNDVYVISDVPRMLRVQLNSDIGGYVICSDETGLKADPEGFVLVMW
jgi:hypothetical protein